MIHLARLILALLCLALAGMAYSLCFDADPSFGGWLPFLALTAGPALGWLLRSLTD